MPPVRLKRGGTRNTGSRPSQQLSERQARLITLRAFDAWEAGAPFSRFITLGWGLAGIDAREAVKATGAFVSMARDWTRHHGFVMPWVWVQERGNVLGQHAHILLHVPAELEELFRPLPRRWATLILSGHYVSGTVMSERLASAYNAESNPWQYEAVLLGKLNYMLKCSPVQNEAALGLRGYGHKPWGQRSYVIGKRAGAWQIRRS